MAAEQAENVRCRWIAVVLPPPGWVTLVAYKLQLGCFIHASLLIGLPSYDLGVAAQAAYQAGLLAAGVLE
jgi:hypothetical protein